MFSANYLTIDVLIIIAVQGSDRPRIADPEIDGIRLLTERNACPYDINFHLPVQT